MPKVEKARQRLPRKPGADARSNRKPVSPSTIVSARPPVRWPIGSEPKRWAYIWPSPQGSKRRHQGKVAAGEDLSCLGVVEADLHSDRARRAHLRLQQRLLEPRFALACHDNLAARIDDRLRTLDHEVDALLVHQARHEREQGTSRDRQPELFPDIVGVQ